MDPSGYKYGPSDYEREIINGEHTYYNWEMAWKLGGDGRLRPDPNSWNNIGRFIREPGPTGVVYDKQGNKYYSYQDPITGRDNAYYTDSEGRRVYSDGDRNYVWNSEPYYSDRWVAITVDGTTKFKRDFGVLGYRYYFTFAENGGGDQKDPLLEFVGFNHGIPEFETSRNNNDWGAVTPGPFIIYPKGGSKDPYYNTHEPGHVIQFLILKGYKRYIPMIAIPSLITATFFPNHHQDMPWEKSANQLWYWLTGEYDPSNELYFGPK